MLKEFREFILRGNLVDLAVAVVIGTAFTAVVKALVTNLITPIIAAIGGKPDFSDLAFTINGSTFGYGAFINALIAFLIIAAVVFFLVIKPVNLLMARFQPATAVDVETRPCPECLSLNPPMIVDESLSWARSRVDRRRTLSAARRKFRGVLRRDPRLGFAARIGGFRLSDIPIGAARCAFCTSRVAAPLGAA